MKIFRYVLLTATLVVGSVAISTIREAPAAPVGGGGMGGGGSTSTCKECDCHGGLRKLISCYCIPVEWGGSGCDFGHDALGNSTCQTLYGPCEAPDSALSW